MEGRKAGRIGGWKGLTFIVCLLYTKQCSKNFMYINL